MNAQNKIAKQVIDIEIEALELLRENLDSKFEIAVKVCQDCLLNMGKIVIIGVGKSGNIGRKISATLNSTGSTSVVLDVQNALHGDLGVVSPNDCIIALSYSGETAELLALLPYLKVMNVKIVGITGKENSSLCNQADTCIITPVEREACPLGLAPTSSTTSALVAGDALAMTLLDQRGFTKEEFAKYHPAGSLGRRLLLKVSDIMRTGNRLAQVTESSTIEEAINTMIHSRSGLCVVIDEQKRTVGVFTHGDFARAYNAEHHISSDPVANHMTRNVVSILESAYALTAKESLTTNEVDDLVVIDESGIVVGVIDSQDLNAL